MPTHPQPPRDPLAIPIERRAGCLEPSVSLSQLGKKMIVFQSLLGPSAIEIESEVTSFMTPIVVNILCGSLGAS